MTQSNFDAGSPSGTTVVAQSPTINVTNHVDAGAIDDAGELAELIADRSVSRVLQALDVTQQQAPATVDPFLPGAV
jgi:hypothetical protein